jgi:hypothetical protein
MRLARNLTLASVAIGILAVTIVGFAFEKLYGRIEKLTDRKGSAS